MTIIKVPDHSLMVGNFFCDVVLPVHLFIFAKINSFRGLQRRLASVLLLIKFYIGKPQDERKK